MAKYDIENFVYALEAILKADLNTRIAAIISEKGDTVELKTIDSNAYFIQTLDERVVNYNPFVYIQVDEVEVEGIGPATSEKISVTAVILVSQTNADAAIDKRLFRYTRALKEVIETNWVNNTQRLKMTVKSLSPSPFVYGFANNGTEYRAAAVQVEATLA